MGKAARRERQAFSRPGSKNYNRMKREEVASHNARYTAEAEKPSGPVGFKIVES